MNKFDPWGPISAVLFDGLSSEIVKNAVSLTGIVVDWSHIQDDPYEGNPARIRKLRPLIEAAYIKLDDDHKGLFAQIVAKKLVALAQGDKLEEALNDIGWSVESGELKTQDAILSEQFFPPGTPYDAYVAIRSIIEKATKQIFIIDAYMGSTIFTTLRSVPTSNLSVKLLTTDKQVKADFQLEANKFSAQFPGVDLHVRTTSDFHDRFILVDNTDSYHVGASINHAGKRAFLISKLEDRPVLDLLKNHIDTTWNGAVRII